MLIFEASEWTGMYEVSAVVVPADGVSFGSWDAATQSGDLGASEIQVTINGVTMKTDGQSHVEYGFHYASPLLGSFSFVSPERDLFFTGFVWEEGTWKIRLGTSSGECEEQLLSDHGLIGSPCYAVGQWVEQPQQMAAFFATAEVDEPFLTSVITLVSAIWLWNKIVRSSR